MRFRMLAISCVLAYFPHAFGQDDAVESPPPAVGQAAKSNQDITPDLESSFEASPPTTTQRPTVPAGKQVLRVVATVERPISQLKAGQAVYLYQQANFAFRRNEFYIGGTGVDTEPCPIYEVHRQQDDHVDVSLVVPRQTAELVTHMVAEERQFFVKLAEPRPARVEPQLKIFQLQQVNAEDAKRTIAQLFHGDVASLAVDQRSNSLIVRGNANQLAEIEALLIRLDSSPAATIGSKSSLDDLEERQPNMSLKTSKGTLDPATSHDSSPNSIDVLRSRLEELEGRCMNIAQRLRQLEQQQENPQPSQQAGKLRSQLREAVADSFRVRQQLQRAELAQFRQRMQRIAQSIELRDRIADQVINRRVEDLLNPNLQWDGRVGEIRAGTTSGSKAKRNESGLLERRVEIQQQFVAHLEAMYRTGNIPLGQLLQGQLELQQARLEAATTASERLQVRRSVIDVLQQLGETLEVQVQAGVTSRSELLEVQSALLKERHALLAEFPDSEDGK